ncbi:AsnC family transcriptional regulator [Amycolatopsis sp. A133]|uniref:Lrp/AsnC family transcriptional regulator n=1 Tax=Amycolatopsis sp. A133 TaxID=3064472 RepID=UPI0027FDE94E|nr:AsnC family transcriptional regulator [Amycolatopsis sp. A133]MDQ7806936.1 AsnC family transcriptional regulator [Amycolatopsis sp. A133]
MALDRLDDLDRGLLHALQIDGRAPFRRIGEVLGVSDQTVARRYARLRSTRGLRVVGLSDPVALAQEQWMVRVRATPGTASEIADALARRSDTGWISLCSGGTEIVTTVYGTGIEPLLLEALPRTRLVLDVRADQVLHVFDGGAGKPFTKHGPLQAHHVAQLTEALPGPTGPPSRVDVTDRRILEVLRSDGRATVEELMAATEVAASTVRRRLHDLRAGGVLHLDVDVDLGVFELPVRTMLWLTVGAGDFDTVGQALAAHAEVAFAAATTGSANIFASVSTRDAAALYRYLTTVVAGLPFVGAVETASALRNVKAATTHYGARRARDTPVFHRR